MRAAQKPQQPLSSSSSSEVESLPLPLPVFTAAGHYVAPPPRPVSTDSRPPPERCRCGARLMTTGRTVGKCERSFLPPAECEHGEPVPEWRKAATDKAVREAGERRAAPLPGDPAAPHVAELEARERRDAMNDSGLTASDRMPGERRAAAVAGAGLLALDATLREAGRQAQERAKGNTDELLSEAYRGLARAAVMFGGLNVGRLPTKSREAFAKAVQLLTSARSAMDEAAPAWATDAYHDMSEEPPEDVPEPAAPPVETPAKARARSEASKAARQAQEREEYVRRPHVPLLADEDFEHGAAGHCYVCGEPRELTPDDGGTDDYLGEAHNLCLNALPPGGRRKRDRLQAAGLKAAVAKRSATAATAADEGEDEDTIGQGPASAREAPRTDAPCAAPCPVKGLEKRVCERTRGHLGTHKVTVGRPEDEVVRTWATDVATAPGVTPGPWVVEPQREDERSKRGSIQVTKDGSPVVVATLVYAKDNEEAKARVLADAHLVAAAPDLHDALLQLVREVRRAGWRGEVSREIAEAERALRLAGVAS